MAESAFAGKPVVVMVAGVPWENQPLPAHHITRELSRRAAVLFVEPGSRAIRGTAAGRTRMVDDTIAVFTPLVPPARTRPVVREIVRATLDRQVAGCLRKLGGEPVAVVIEPPQRSSLRILGDVRRVHYATDDFVAGASLMGVSQAWVRQREAELADQLDLVIAVSTVIGDAWAARGVPSEVIPNGCDVELFASTSTAVPAADVVLPRPIAGVAGTLSDRIDVGLLTAVAERMSLLLVGPRSRSSPNPDLDALVAMDSVQWVGPQPFSSMPGYLAACDVGLTPYTDTDFNRASFPLKTLEYLAAGLPVVATDLPSVRALGTDLVEVASSPDEFAERALAAAGGVDGSTAEERRRFASGYSWGAQGDRFARALGLSE